MEKATLLTLVLALSPFAFMALAGVATYAHLASGFQVALMIFWIGVIFIGAPEAFSLTPIGGFVFTDSSITGLQKVLAVIVLSALTFFISLKVSQLVRGRVSESIFLLLMAVVVISVVGAVALA